MPVYAYDEDGEEFEIGVDEFIYDTDTEERRYLQERLGAEYIAAVSTSEWAEAFIEKDQASELIERFMSSTDFDAAEAFGNIIGSIQEQTAHLRVNLALANKRVVELEEKLNKTDIIIDRNLVTTLEQALELPDEQFQALPTEIIEKLMEKVEIATAPVQKPEPKPEPEPEPEPEDEPELVPLLQTVDAAIDEIIPIDAVS